MIFASHRTRFHRSNSSNGCSSSQARRREDDDIAGDGPLARRRRRPRPRFEEMAVPASGFGRLRSAVDASESLLLHSDEFTNVSPLADVRPPTILTPANYE